MASFFADVKAWAAGRWWQWRLALLLFLTWDATRHLKDPEAGGLFAGITFGVHEFGHLLFAFFGQFMTVLGGSLNQLLLPVATAALFWYYRDYFGIGVAGMWLGSSLLDLARYVADARVQELDLVGFGDDPQHDWTFLLGQMHALQYDTRIAAVLRGLALLALLASIGFSVWVLLQMAIRRGEAVAPVIKP